jgi:hypothetical protein
MSFSQPLFEWACAPIVHEVRALNNPGGAAATAVGTPLPSGLPALDGNLLAGEEREKVMRSGANASVAVVIQDCEAVKAYREHAQALRAQASQETKRRSREAALQLAGEYEWRAALLEAAMGKRDDGTFSRSDVVFDATSNTLTCPGGKRL